MTSPADIKRPKSPATAVLGGAGVGTGMIGLAQILGTHTTWGQILVWAAPSLGLASHQLLTVVNALATKLIDDWQVRASLRVLRQQQANPRGSLEHNREITSLLEAAEKLIAQAELRRIQRIRSP